MARTPYVGLPDVQQQGPVGAFEHAQATPQDFGAGIGQAEQGLAQAGERAGNVLSDNAVRLEQMAQVRNASNATSQYSNALGDEYAKFGAMEGQAAHDYYPTFQKTINDLRDQAGASLTSPYAKQQFDEQSRFMMNQYNRSGAMHAAMGLKQSFANADESKITSLGSFGVNMQNNPSAVVSAAQGVTEAARRRAVTMGQDPDSAGLVASGQYYHRIFESMVSQGNTAGAQGLYQQARPFMDANSIAEVDRLMKPATDRMTGDAAAQSVYGGVVGMNSARQDPVVRGAIIDQANKSGVDPSIPLTVAQIESSMGGRPDSPGNSHQGVFQLGPQEWAQVGGTAANRGDKVAQSQLGTQWVAGAQKAASNALGRPAEGWETYMVHQQGTSGGPALLTAPAGESAVDALLPAYKGNRGLATQAITNNGGSADVTAQQFTSMWQAKYARAGVAASGNNLPTSGDARPPLTGDQILEATQHVENDPTLSPEAKQWAHARLEQRLSAYNQALRADAENSINGIVSKALQNPYSVTMSDIATNKSLTGTEKASLARELVSWQSGKAQGDGDGFGDVVDRIQAPLGDTNRLNSSRDLVPLFGHGLTYSGFEKAQKFMKDRDAPDGPTLKAAMDTWKSQILGGAIGDPKFATPASRQRWVDFLAAVQPQIDQAKGKMPMADVVGSNGPVQKMIDSGHYVLSAEEMFQSMVPGGPATTAAPVAPVVGHWYVPVGNFSGQFREVSPGTAGARRLTAPTFAPENFENPSQLPTAPTSG